MKKLSKRKLNTNKHSWIAFGRISLGLLWLYEIIWGGNWKWDNPEWVGAGAGTWLKADVVKAIERGTWEWAEWILNATVVPYAEFLSYSVIVLQLAIAISLISGLFVRPIATLGLIQMSFIYLTGHTRVSSFLVVGFLFVLATKAGMFYGLDAWLVKKLKKAKTVPSRITLWLIDKPLPKKLWTWVGMPASLLLITYFSLQTVALESARFRMTSLDISVILALTVVGFALAKKVEIISLLSRLIGGFVGFKFLHEVWVRFPAALNGLPGWSSAEELREVFSLIIANHWPFMATITETIFDPIAGFWAMVFAIVQIGVGALLIVNYKPRIAHQVGMAYLTLLMLLGFTRYVPFILVLLILAYGLRWGASLSRYVIPVAAAAFVLFFLVAFVGGVTPGDYREQMGPVVAAMLALFSAGFLTTALIQNRKNHR